MFSIFFIFSFFQFFNGFLYVSLFVPLCFLHLSLFFHVCFFTFHDCVSLSSLFFMLFIFSLFFHYLFQYFVNICHVFLYCSFFYYFKFDVVERRFAQMHFSVF